MEITEALIARFFNNECDEAETQAVKNYFIRHPEALKKYMTEQSWRSFETHEAPPEPVSAKMLDVIRQHTYRGYRVKILRWGWAAAAAMLTVTFGAYWYFQHVTAIPAKVVTNKEIIQPAPSSGLRNTANNTTQPMVITLEDSTRVKLAPQSELVYRVPFLKDRRDITLKGQAIFYVAKDASRPFTVYAGKLATTAIGTVFRITAFTGKTTSVHLLSGKVRVAADSNVRLNGTNITYLLPGQELQLDMQQHLVLLNRKVKDNAHKPILTHKPSAKQPDSSIIVFHNEPLEHIFTTLSEKYGTKIAFRPEQISGMTFTGKYDHEKETLTEFIQTISLLNNLVMREENGMIMIESQ